MRSVAAMVVLWLSLVVQAQTVPIGGPVHGVTLGATVTAAEIEQAKKILAMTAPKDLKLAVGEFEAIQPDEKITTPLLWLGTNRSCLQKIDVPAGVPFHGYMRRRGDAAAKYHLFPARSNAWVVVIGISEGSAAISIVRNGDKPEQPPVLVDELLVTVGGGAPVPPPAPGPVVEDEVTKALRVEYAKDTLAGKGDRQVLLRLSGIYQAASQDDLATVKTVSDFDNLLYQARLAAGIPEADKALPAVRNWIMAYLQAKVGNDGTQVLRDDAKRLAKAHLAKIADGLTALTK